MGVLEHARTPVLLALLLFLPAYFIGVAVLVLPDTELPVTVADETTMVALPDLVAALMTPTVGALVGGIVGLFLMQSSRDVDRRLVVCGFRHVEVVLSRLALVATGAVLVTGVAVGVALLLFSPTSVWLFVGATLVAAVLYGLVGIVIGVLLNKLAGVYVMVFGPLVDIILLQNPLASDTAWWVRLFPGHYVAAAAVDASFRSGFDWWNVVPIVGTLVALVGLATGALYAASR